jgi:hypothetical protein
VDIFKAERQKKGLKQLKDLTWIFNKNIPIKPFQKIGSMGINSL